MDTPTPADLIAELASRLTRRRELNEAYPNHIQTKVISLPFRYVEWIMAALKPAPAPAVSGQTPLDTEVCPDCQHPAYAHDSPYRDGTFCCVPQCACARSFKPSSAPVASAPKDETKEKTICRAEEPETTRSPPVLREVRNGVITMDAKNIPAFIAQRLRDVASFNGCVGLRNGICVELSPDDPVEWCKYCVQGAAAKIIEASL